MTTPALPLAAHDGPYQVTAQLEDELTASGSARRLVRATMEDWHLAVLTDDVVLAVSELVNNATLHGEPPVTLTLRRDAQRLTIVVSDLRPASAEHAVPLPGTEPLLESGRGQGIVAAVARTTGVEDAGAAGKQVYATWDVPATTE